jgi:hypothetical protein
MLYVPFGGHFGDCGDYHGWVVGVSLPNAAKVISWLPLLSDDRRGGIERNSMLHPGAGVPLDSKQAIAFPLIERCYNRFIEIIPEQDHD